MENTVSESRVSVVPPSVGVMDRMARTPGTAAAVLRAARADRTLADAAERRILSHAVDWAVIHRVTDPQDAAGWRTGELDAAPVPVAGPGAPLLGEWCVAEFAVALGMSTDAGKALLGEAVEIRYRLPRLWGRLVREELTAWRARRVARATMALSLEAAQFVDQHVAPVAHRVGPAQLDRLVAEAEVRFMPAQALRRAREAAESRHVSFHTRQVSFDGTVRVDAELDLADALELDHALGRGARRLADLGCGESLDVRRAMAVGELARTQLSLDLAEPAPGSGVTTPRRSRRRVELHVHLSEAALTGTGGIQPGLVARVENTRTPISVEQVRAWCGVPGVAVRVRPVLDLADHVRVDQYEIPERVAEPVTERDGCCVFPWCTRPARPTAPDEHSCDRDHVVPYGQGGATCTCQLAVLCRRHHRLKTHSPWRYQVLEPGSYLWTSPHGYRFLRDHQGTLDVSSPDPPEPPGPRQAATAPAGRSGSRPHRRARTPVPAARPDAAH